MVKGVCLNSLVGPRSKSVKLAFSKCQQYEALFSFSLLYKLINTLMFTFPRAVAQQCHQCRLSWSPREFYVHQVPCTWGWVQTSLVPSDRQWRKASPVAEAQHRQAWRDGGCSLLKIFIFFLQIPHLDNTNQDMLMSGWLPLLFTLVQGEHRKYASAQPLWTQEEDKKGVF